MPVVEGQYQEVIGASDAWVIADEGEEEQIVARDVKATNSARRIRALVNQITGKKLLSPFPSRIDSSNRSILTPPFAARAHPIPDIGAITGP